ncbi:MAG TPA: M20/M25/M40 family metallo-hydrolase [Vicinamibacteria bacterium]|nr:M20/M25/M40 family metallo-hydrolase [Vicinamibacteria bacterium]
MRAVSPPSGMSDLDKPDISSTLYRIVANSDANYFDNGLDPSVFYGDLEGRHAPELSIVMPSAPTQRPESVLIRTKLTRRPARVGLVDRRGSSSPWTGRSRTGSRSCRRGRAKTALATQWLDQRRLDDKITVQGILEAVEMQLKLGFKPKRTIYLAFGQDEEVGGPEGASNIVAVLKSRDVNKVAFVLDEGVPITTGLFPGIKGPLARRPRG